VSATWQDIPCQLSRRPYSSQKHRRVWEKRHGPIPPGLFVCHRCDDNRCWEIAHLFLGTPKQNTYDAIAKGRFAFHPENLTPLHPRPGTLNGRAKLAEHDVLAILASDEMGTVLAARYGVTSALITAIRKRRVWKSLEVSA
jgi:Autographiviridae endonuclease